jgi:flagellar L-ring protein FlgH
VNKQRLQLTTRARAASIVVSLALLIGGTLITPTAAAQTRGAEPAPVIRSFVADPRARVPGDVLTVIIVESASVQQSARTQTRKGQSVNGSLLQRDGEVQSWDANLDTTYDGGGRIERSGRLVARLAVVVREVDPNGNLVIAGAQDILINNERQHIRLEGLVRPTDIGPDNTVPSWRVTGAEITLRGRGFLTRKQSPGLLQQLLSYFGV